MKSNPFGASRGRSSSRAPRSSTRRRSCFTQSGPQLLSPCPSSRGGTSSCSSSRSSTPTTWRPRGSITTGDDGRRINQTRVGVVSRVRGGKSPLREVSPVVVEGSRRMRPEREVAHSSPEGDRSISMYARIGDVSPVSAYSTVENTGPRISNNFRVEHHAQHPADRAQRTNTWRALGAPLGSQHAERTRPRFPTRVDHRRVRLFGRARLSTNRSGATSRRLDRPRPGVAFTHT